MRRCFITRSVRARESSGATGRRSRPSVRARATRSRTPTTFSIGRMSRWGVRRRRCTRSRRSRSGRSSATSTASPARSTTSAATRTWTGAGTRRWSWPSVLEQRPEDALARVAAALQRAEDTTGVSVLGSTLHRLRGWAFMQTGDLGEAENALDESLRLARLDDENFGIRSADYEVALTLDAVARLRALRGEAAAEAEAERDEIFARLGVVAVAQPPLPDATGSDG